MLRELVEVLEVEFRNPFEDLVPMVHAFELPSGHWLPILNIPLLRNVVDSKGIDLSIELRLRGGQDVLAPSPDGSLYLFEWYQVGGSRLDDSESTVLPLDTVLVEVVAEDRLLDCAALLHQRHDDLPGPCVESNLTLDERMGLYYWISADCKGGARCTSFRVDGYWNIR